MGATAQTAQPNFQRFTSPAGLVHYDLATGTVTKVIRPRQVTGLAANTQVGVQRIKVNVFNNTITNGYWTSGVFGAEWVDWAALDNDILMTQIRFGYVTVVRDISNHGPGASLNLGFYTGTSGGAGVCNLGTEIARFAFTGLPGMTASYPPSFKGGQCYHVTATLASALAVPSGQVGWGYTFEDSHVTGGSDTGPLMTDFGINTGWADLFQWWSVDPASNGSCVGTFFFGGCSQPVPADPGLEGLAVTVQAAQFAGPGSFFLTNSCDCGIGG